MNEQPRTPGAEGEGPGPAPVVRGARGPVVCVLAAALLALAGAGLAVQQRYPLRVWLATLDAQLTYGALMPEGGAPTPADLEVTREVLARRLEMAGMLARVEVAPPGLRVHLRAGEEARAAEVCEPRGEVRFYLVAELPQAEHDQVLRRAADPAGPLPPRGPVVVLWDRGGRPEPLEDLGPDGLPRWVALEVASAHVAGGSSWWPALRLELSPASGRALTALTGQSLGRRAALVVDEVIQATPVIAGPVGAEVMLDLGASVDPDELERLQGILGAGALPVKLVPR